MFPYTNPTGLVHDSGRYREALERCGSLVGHDEVRARQAAERESGATTLTGLGYSVFIDRTAGMLRLTRINMGLDPAPVAPTAYDVVHVEGSSRLIEFHRDSLLRSIAPWI